MLLDWQSGNFILVLVPTRELVTQVYDNFKKLTQFTDMSVVFHGGVTMNKKRDWRSRFSFDRHPGRLIDLYKEGFVDLKNVRGMVLDEADRMFDMGFQQDVFFC